MKFSYPTGWSRNNGYGDPVGKWFERLVSSLDLTDPRLVIHGLGHGGITKLHSAGAPVNIVETITGIQQEMFIGRMFTRS
ncbi:MAG: hypothetical protein OJF50_005019 [Nitrospira sp.]|nr:hypothetical protein [Nitrospira sp.]